MFGLSATEIIVILVVALLVFGPKRLPGIARRLGRTLGEFRKAAQELKDGFESDLMKASPGNPASGTVPSADKETSPAAAGESAVSAVVEEAGETAAAPASQGSSDAAPGGEA